MEHHKDSTLPMSTRFHVALVGKFFDRGVPGHFVISNTHTVYYTSHETIFDLKKSKTTYHCVPINDLLSAINDGELKWRRSYHILAIGLGKRRRMDRRMVLG